MVFPNKPNTIGAILQIPGLQAVWVCFFLFFLFFLEFSQSTFEKLQLNGFWLQQRHRIKKFHFRTQSSVSFRTEDKVHCSPVHDVTKLKAI